MPTQDQVEERHREISHWYSTHRFKCKLFEQAFEEHLSRLMQEEGLRDARIETRTKTVESFVAKACKVSGEIFKYQNPDREITDAIGARVMVPLVTDIDPVRESIKRRFIVEEESERGEEEGSADVPGYRSLHLLVRLGEGDLQRREFAEFGDMIVEIQVRTILQHAWAALQHDLGYKADRPPSPAVRRRITALAGLLELADREFVEVKQSGRESDRSPSAQLTPPPTSNSRLTPASLRVFVEAVMGEEDAAAHSWYVELARVVNQLGMQSTDELSSLLGAWRERAPELAKRVRGERPWANSALVFDLLLRLADSSRYFARSCSAEGLESTEERQHGFVDELAAYRDLAPT